MPHKGNLLHVTGSSSWPLLRAWLSLRCHGLHGTFLNSKSELLPRRIDLQWDLLGRPSLLCYDRRQGWGGVQGKTEPCARITKTKNKDLWTFSKMFNPLAAPPWGKDLCSLPHRAVHESKLPRQLIEVVRHWKKKRGKLRRARAKRAELRQSICFCHALNSLPFLPDSI